MLNESQMQRGNLTVSGKKKKKKKVKKKVVKKKAKKKKKIRNDNNETIQSIYSVQEVDERFSNDSKILEQPEVIPEVQEDEHEANSSPKLGYSDSENRNNLKEKELNSHQRL